MKQVFRQTKPQSIFWIALRTYLYAAAIWYLTLWLFPSWIVRLEDGIGIARAKFSFQFPVALMLFGASAAINLSSAYVMAAVGKGTPLPLDCAPNLVVKGPYRFVRNPMAIGGLGMGFAVAVGWGSWAVAAYVIIGMLFWNWVVRPIEERDLSQRFGEPYDRYRGEVKCWFPNLRGYQM